MNSPTERFTATLKQSGYSVTKTRHEVLLALLSEEPLTMSELVARLHDKVDRASVYRTISLFEQLGIVLRLQIGWKYKLELSEEYSTHHHHLTCIQCGQTSPVVEDKQLETKINDLAYRAGFSPRSHQLEIRGLCSSCRGPRQLAPLMA